MWIWIVAAIIVLLGVSYKMGWIAPPKPAMQMVGAVGSMAPAAGTPQAVVAGLPVARSGPLWQNYNGVDLTGGAPAGQSAPDGSVVYLGTYSAEPACAAACVAGSNCHAYTWHDGSGGAYANQCFGMPAIVNSTPMGATYSGELISEGFDLRSAAAAANNRVATFSNTLSRRLGMGGAGSREPLHTNSCVGTFDCMKENITANTDVAYNTMYAGYQNRSVLPG